MAAVAHCTGDSAGTRAALKKSYVRGVFRGEAPESFLVTFSDVERDLRLRVTFPANA